ncbi:hypothetical protein MMC08_008365 [Hypocenomyce scalaris]|nr:hypothetical protein [Hypocenomyce scalaris]
MAGMEQLEIHSKSYLVRWVSVKAEHTISWSIQPHKKSINFGIFKHPSSGNTLVPKLPLSTFEPPPTPGLRPQDASQEAPASRNASSTATEKLKSIGLIPISWHGTCEPNKVSMGTYDVPVNEGGMYALVFDNTFAKQLSKTATFVLLTYPTNAAPQSSHHMRHVLGTSSGSSGSLKAKCSPRLVPVQHGSSESLIQIGSADSGNPMSTSPLYPRQGDSESSVGSNFYTGVLRKRRRKRHQGYARRFFSLDYTSSTLSYYHNRNTLALRGSVPLSLAAVGANGTTREISIDSGAEVWHLKASNQKDFEAWKAALGFAASNSISPTTPIVGPPIDTRHRHQSGPIINVEEDREWAMVESLVGRVAGSRDAVRRLAKDTDPKYLPLNALTPSNDGNTDSHVLHAPGSGEQSPSEYYSNTGYFKEAESRPFWKRKPSGGRRASGVFKRNVSAQSTVAAPRGASPNMDRESSPTVTRPPLQPFLEEGLHDHCMALLRDLDFVVTDFTALIAESKRRRIPTPVPATSRVSMDSQVSEEFFDAEAGEASQLLEIHRETDDEDERSDHDLAVDEDDWASASDVEGSGNLGRKDTTPEGAALLFPPKVKSLTPLPIASVKRRSTIPPPKVNPPSLIGFLRKNVGKDFSTISMPVSANEPTSLLQRAAEQMEYSSLLDSAVTADAASGERLLYITAFAISSLSAARSKERAIRKPFNPMLGETFELVREDKGFRFMSEKVSHRPVRLACHAESSQWALTHSPMPTQKFWGKSAELVTEGKVRVVLHSTGDRFSWTQATCFLRNIIAGEKYVEPVGTMTITNETTGQQAIVTFKSGGMFSGRSEDVIVQTYDTQGEELANGLIGKWTSTLNVTENGTPTSRALWTVGELVPSAAKTYGLTSFAASLNEITTLEDGKVAPTDSRLRPDQRAAEQGDLDRAEVLKAKLEEAQRDRRKLLEENGEGWTPRWFTKIESLQGHNEEVWRPRTGKDGYWEERVKGEWKSVEPIFKG